jgi:transposase
MSVTKEQLEADIKENLSAKRIAEKYKIGVTSVRRLLKKFELKIARDPHDTYRELLKDPEFKEKHRIVCRAACNTEEFRAKSSATNKKNWQSPEYREKVLSGITKLHDSIEFKEKFDQRSGKSKQLWQNPEFRDKCVAACNTSEFKSAMSRSSKKNWQDPGYRGYLLSLYSNAQYKERMSQVQKQVWDDPAYREKRDKIVSAPEYKEKMSRLSKRHWQDSEYKEKLAFARSLTPRTLTKPHRKVCALLDSLGVPYQPEAPLGRYGFDIFIPSHNILIEIQGDYWHGLPDVIRNDKAKSTYINEYFPHLKLYYIWEHECLQEERVLEKLKYWLGLTKLELVDFQFSDLQVRKVDDFKKVDEFLYTWHYQYSGRHGSDYGVYLGDLLIAVARFTSPTRQEIATSLGYKFKEVLELSRLCVHPKYQKPNLLTWFLARVRKQLHEDKPEVTCLVSFADSTYGHTGAVYKADNWELNRIVEPNYWYVSDDGFVMHKKTLWNHAKKMSMTESEYASKYGYSKVWGKEKYKFVKKLSYKEI